MSDGDDETKGGNGAVKVGAIVGGGILLWYLLSNLGLGGSGGGTRDVARLHYTLRSDAHLYQDGQAWSLDSVIRRVLAGGRTDVDLSISGGVKQGVVDATLLAFLGAGIAVSRQLSGAHASLYARGKELA